MRYSQFIAGAAVLFFIAAAVFSQDQKITAGDQVFLNAAVLSNKDDLITGLRIDNFKLYEQKTLIPITSFSTENVPMTVGIVIDRSGSTKEVAMPIIRKGLKKFINDNDRNNEYFVMTFGKTQEILLESTNDNAKILEAVDSVPDDAKAKETRFFDAIDAAGQKASIGRFQKRILIILSDGQDNNSKQGLGKVRTALEKYGVTLYLMDLGAIDTRFSSGTSSPGLRGQEARAVAPRGTRLSPAAQDMEDLADASGGLLFPIVTDDDLDMALSFVSKELRNQYRIGFSIPADPDKDKEPKLHNFSIKLESLPKEVEKQKPRIRARNKVLL